MIRATRVSFGGTAGVVTSMALLAGLHAAGASTVTVVSALLIAAVADNLTDSLSVHMYQEAERLEQRAAFAGTLINFATRLVVCLSFVVIVLVLPARAAAPAGLAWGIALLTALTWILARSRQVSVASEIGKHIAVACAIILVSREIGVWISSHVDALLAALPAPR